ncbi:helix-turn-helix transcriptional regulator [Pararhizobium mangrovi]|uniref:helix-turn-helix transcriptional regulator n=1 Tax=Pararhizobium mangrovi TaxID=2590452 RepID=UPI0015E854C3|nr:AraC family transcriptional regulator [Pararhizobium mangrovi]
MGHGTFVERRESGGPTADVSRHLGGALEVATVDTIYAAPHRVVEPIRDGLRLLVVLSGEMCLRVGKVPALEIGVPTCIVVLAEGEHACERIFAEHVPFRSVLLTLDPDLVRRELGGEPWRWLANAEISPEYPLLRSGSLDASARAVAAQLLALGRHADPFYRCAKALELAALVLGRFAVKGPSVARGAMSPGEREMVRRARDMLVDAMHAPPDIATLARACGTNPLKLNRGFHMLYGTTPYAYLQEHRLQTALRLLSGGARSVGQVAEETGYSRTHFANLFRRRFGMMPRDLLRRAEGHADDA